MDHRNPSCSGFTDGSADQEFVPQPTDSVGAHWQKFRTPQLTIAAVLRRVRRDKPALFAEYDGEVISHGVTYD